MYAGSNMVSAEEAKANAYLVAAAPDLLKSLQEFLEIAELYPRAFEWSREIAQAQAAIAKTQGVA